MRQIPCVQNGCMESDRTIKKKEGYEIEAVRNRGYRLLESPDIMSEAEIRSLMDTEWAGKNIVYFDEIDSTNNRAKRAG